jgi:hypothetical protein
MSEMTNDDFFEGRLRQAVIKNHNNEMKALISEVETGEKHVFSELLNKKMKKLFAANKRREVFTIVYKWSKVAVVAVCVSATLVFGTLLTSAEVRKAVGDVIVTWFEKFTKFQSPEISNDFTEREWEPEYLPEGFELTQTLGETGSMYTKSEDIRIIFSYNNSDSSTSVDNEDMTYSTFIENGTVYHLFETTIKDNYNDNIIVWDMDGYRFTVFGNYAIDELLKIALSVK